MRDPVDGRRRQDRTTGQEHLTSPKTDRVTGRLSYQFLKEITDDFSKDRELGAGASGKVFKGVTKNGRQIAVKLLYERPGLEDHLFENELNNLMILEHPNIVSLIGHCNETQKVLAEYNGRVVLAEETHRALCFEYLENGNLKRHLYDESCGPDWNTRYKIIMGICMGLKYIHKGQKKPIYHLDLKPENILLDKNMLPKLADFGLSKILAEDKTRSTANSYGTRGYIPPEYIDRNVISSKFDIFSLGVVIIKIVTGPEGYTESADMSEQDFIVRAEKNWRNRLQAKHNGSLLDAYCQQVKMCIQLAFICVEKDRHKRPDIVTLIEKLRVTEYLIDKSRADLQNKKQEVMMVGWIILIIISWLLRYLIKWNCSIRASTIRTESNRDDDDHRWEPMLGLLIGGFSLMLLLRRWPWYLVKPNCPSRALAVSTEVAREDDDKTEVEEAIMEAIGLGSSKQHGVPRRMMDTDLPCLFDAEQAAFEVFDANCDGFIDAVDLQVVLASLGIPKDASVCRSMIVAAGGCRDGRMNQIQFFRFLQSGLCADC